MKKVLRVLILGFLIISLTGCVKLNVNMDIKKDKSMEFSMIYAINKAYYSDDMGMSEDDKKKAIDAGFSIEDYDDGSMKGYRFYKSIKNIDEVSSTDDVVFNMEEFDNDDGYMFKVKKGIFKNTYTAKLSSVDLNGMDMPESDSTNSFDDNYLNGNSSANYDNNENWYNPDFDAMEANPNGSYSSYGTSPMANYKVDALATSNMDDFSQMGEMMMASMDLSFTVNLPYATKTHNATSVNNNGKQLQWNLANQNLESIDFEFELYNWTNIYLTVAIAIVIIAIVAKIVMDQNKKNTNAAVSAVAAQPEMGNSVMPSVGMGNTIPTPMETPNPVETPVATESPMAAPMGTESTIPTPMAPESSAVPAFDITNPVVPPVETANPVGTGSVGTPVGLDNPVPTSQEIGSPAVGPVTPENPAVTPTDLGASNSAPVGLDNPIPTSQEIGIPAVGPVTPESPAVTPTETGNSTNGSVDSL